MSKEKLRSPEGRMIKIGEESKKTAILIRSNEKRADLVIPNGVEVRPILSSGELGPAKGPGAWTVKPGEFLVKDLKTEEETVIKFSPNSNCFKSRLN